MKIAEVAIRNKTTTLFITFLMIALGIFSFENLGRLEDPEFTIKDAQIMTLYPGGTPTEVEEEVTERIEVAVQQLAQLKRVESLSKDGLSIITPKIKDQYDKSSLPQVWDELRRKVNDIQSQLPPGAGPSVVNDDFGDVYGILLALKGKGFSYKELEEASDFIRRELLLVKDVGKVQVYGVQQQQVYVEISREKLAGMGLSLDNIFKTLEKQNLVTPSGATRVDDEYIRIRPSGNLKSVEEIGEILISGHGDGKLIFFKDIADIKRGYVDPPKKLVFFNNDKALGIGVSISSGGNVVELGKLIEKKLYEIASQLPIGLEIDIISYQPTSVTLSIDNFMVSLMQALAIVLAVLMIFMGLRSGILIGVILLLTVLGTFVGMFLWGINLERISLGALIIALGMLVDNAIVVTEGILVRIQQGKDRFKSAIEVVNQTAMPLLGATFIAILAFAAIGLSDDSTGEYTRSLFQVILISLGLSWIIAITITPLFCIMFLEGNDDKDGKQGEEIDPYAGIFFQVYKGILVACLKVRYLTAGITIGLLALALYGFGYLENAFFPESSRAQFMLHYWMPEGTDIRRTSADMQKISEHIRKIDGITNVSMFVGSGAPRFILTYTPEKEYAAYGIMLVDVKEYQKIPDLMKQIQEYTDKNFLDAQVKLRKFVLGPGREDTMEVRFSGPDPTELRKLADQAKKIMYDDGGIIGIKDNWRDRVPIVRPIFADSQARETGITKEALDATLQMTFSGLNVGVYREDIKLLPIVSRAPASERNEISNLRNVQIWSPLAQSTIPLRQILEGFDTTWEDAAIQRRNRKRTITVAGTQKIGNASVALARIMPKIDAIELPTGYGREWGGEYEDAADAQEALFKNIPMTIVLIVLVLVILFNAIRQPLIIVLTVPLAVIGVTLGLLVTGQSFGFMALLGFLSLTGMLIKNSIVLIDQIDLEIREGKEPYHAIVDSSVGRMRPVAMAAVTTVLGMIPLLGDIFFIGMAVTIMAGLSFATILTLLVVPVMYSIFFRIKPRPLGDGGRV